MARILSAGAMALLVTRISADTMKLASYMNMNSSEFMTRILSAGATALSDARI